MKKFWYYLDLVRLSAGASLLIGLGDFVLLKIGEPLGPFLFAFGLLGVCVLGLNLFTGKCGFLIEDKMKIWDLLIILVVNLVCGYAFGVIFSLFDTAIISVAETKVAYRRGTKLGILLGVPLFIFCGFQHSIANVITMGVAADFSWTILLCAAGNFAGAIIAWGLCRKY